MAVKIVCPGWYRLDTVSWQLAFWVVADVYLLIFSQCGKQNKQLHETQRIVDMEGIYCVREELQKENDKGLGRQLPASDFSHIFCDPAKTLLTKEDELQKIG